MSDRNDLNITLPEWYQMELQTHKTMQRLSGVHELEFYLNHPDEYIRHQAILRLGQLRSRDAVAPLNKIMDDPLEISINRDIAAWVLKSTGLVGNNDFYIGNHYLDRFTGTEKLKDFYYPSFIEGRTTPEYHFGSSGIEALLSEETLLIKAESQEEKAELPFSLNRWFKTWFITKVKNLRNGSEELGKKSADGLKNIIAQIMHPQTKRIRNKKQDRQKAEYRGAEINTAHAVKSESSVLENETPLASATKFLMAEMEAPQEARMKSASVETQAPQEARMKPVSVETQAPQDVQVKSPIAAIMPFQVSNIELNHNSAETSQKEHIPVSTENIHSYYMKPFTLKSSPQDRESRRSPARSKIYVRGNSRELSFASAVKSFALKLLKIILLPFVILWNQKVVFLTLLVCLYLFFSFVPVGRMLFYRRSPELARMNDKAVKTAQTWIADKVTQLQEMASEYELVRNIKKRMVTDTTEPEIAPATVKYIVAVKKLNLRKEPGTDAEKLLLLEQNMIVEFLNKSVDNEDGETWLYIKAPDGTVGWSYANYLKKLEVDLEAYEGK